MNRLCATLVGCVALLIAGPARAAVWTQDFQTANTPDTSYGYNGFAITNVFANPDTAYVHGTMGRALESSVISGGSGSNYVGVASPTANNFTWDAGFQNFPATVQVGPATDFGAGFSGTWPTSLPGIQSHVDLYLNTGWDSGSGFDYSVAISDTNAVHRRDFIFHVYADGSSVYVDASNNSDLKPKSTILNNGSKVSVSTSGWYRFAYNFHETAGGVLEVTMTLSQGMTELDTWTLSNPTDIIGTTVGGRNYGWFPTLDLIDNSTHVDLYVDNVYYNNPEPGTLGLVGIGAFGLMRRRARA